MSRNRWVVTHRCPTVIHPVQPHRKFRDAINWLISRELLDLCGGKERSAPTWIPWNAADTPRSICTDQEIPPTLGSPGSREVYTVQEHGRVWREASNGWQVGGRRQTDDGLGTWWRALEFAASQQSWSDSRVTSSDEMRWFWRVSVHIYRPEWSKLLTG